LREKYSPQEIALLRYLKNEDVYMVNLEQNDGTGRPAVVHKVEDTLIEIDTADQFTPDD
jgi:nitrate reductase (NAD(P)H)